MFTSAVSSTVRHGVSRRKGLANTIAATCARETATLMRFIEKRNAMLRGSSSQFDVVMDTRQMGAS